MKKFGVWLIMSILSVMFIIFVVPSRVSAATWDTTVTLTENTTVNGDLVVNKSLNLNGWKLTVTGNMIANADVTTGTYGKLVVGGDYTQKNYELDCADGKVDITGN